MAAAASFSVSRENRQYWDSQTPKTYIYQVSREFWKLLSVESFNSNQAIYILMGSTT